MTPTVINIGLFLYEIIHRRLIFFRFLRLLFETLRLPTFCLVDCDPYGFDILTTYRFGSLVRDVRHLACQLSSLDYYSTQQGCSCAPRAHFHCYFTLFFPLHHSLSTSCIFFFSSNWLKKQKLCATQK